MEQSYNDVYAELLKGFDEKNHFALLLVERSYQIACNVIPVSWALIYDLCMMPLLQHLLNMVVMPPTLWHLKK